MTQLTEQQRDERISQLLNEVTAFIEKFEANKSEFDKRYNALFKDEKQADDSAQNKTIETDNE